MGEFGFKGWIDGGTCEERKERLAERERKALFSLQEKGQDDDDACF